MKKQLQDLKKQSAALLAEAATLQKQHAELLPQAQQPTADVAEIQARLIAALGSGDDKARQSINAELAAAKNAAQAVETAQNGLSDISGPACSDSRSERRFSAAD